MKLYTDLALLDQDNRAQMPDVLKQLINHRSLAENISVYGEQVAQYQLVNTMEAADLCVLPMNLLFFIRHKKLNAAKQFTRKSNALNKPLAVWTGGGDYGVRIQLDGAWSFSRTVYKSRQLPKQQILPDFVWNMLPIDTLTDVNLRAWQSTPTVGFCGQANGSLTSTMAKILNTSWYNLRARLHLSPFLSHPLLPATRLRAQVLDILERAPNIETKFIRHKQYQAGAQTEDQRKDALQRFYNNLRNTDYTVCVRGEGNFSKRLYETLSMGRIPIFVNTDCVLPFEQEIDWRKLCVWVEQNEINQLPEKLRAFHAKFDASTFKQHQNRCRAVWQKYLSFSGYFSNFPKLFVEQL